MVNIDEGKDYLNYLRPFILQVLVDNTSDPVTDRLVHDRLITQFGLEIPGHTIQLVLKRFARANLIKRQEGVYWITGSLPNPGIAGKKSEAERHIHAVINGLIEFAKLDGHSIANEEEAVTAITGFLLEFNIDCLRAYLQGTAIPATAHLEKAHIVLVSDFVRHLQRANPERFESFLIMVQGHMLANALLCPDLQFAPKSYKGVTFYLDTPLLVHQLGLEGTAKKGAIDELIDLVRRLGGTVAYFSHSRRELDLVIKGAAAHVNTPGGRGAVVLEAQRIGKTKSDLLLLAGQVDNLLADIKINSKKTPPYIVDYQIDETIFEQILEDEVNYYNPRAREFDVNSVRSIYVLRGNTKPASIERCRAICITSNVAFARAAAEYGKRNEGVDEVSSVITDFSLANMAWLKAPMGAPSLPQAELLAYSYAALQPSRAFLERFLEKINKLQAQGRISERDHQLLRSSTIAQEELMGLTLGNEDSLTEETVIEILRRVTNEIKQEEAAKVAREIDSHRETKTMLEQTKAELSKLQKKIYWKCKRKSQICALFVSCTLSILLIFGIVGGLGLKARSPWFGWPLFLGSALLAVATLANLIIGTTIRHIHEGIQARCLRYFLRRESKATGVSFGANVR